MTNDRRLCEACGKPINARNAVGICSRPSCRREYFKRWRDLNPDQRERGRVYCRQYHQDRPIQMAVLRAKSRARNKGLEFSITADELPPIPKVCPVLGIPMVPGKKLAEPGSPSLDRIDSTKGYTPDNVHWISWRANTIKGDATVEELSRVTEYFAGLVS